MASEPNAAKKPYSSPSLVVLDASAAKATFGVSLGFFHPWNGAFVQFQFATATSLRCRPFLCRV
jgi:hypothetical protein